MSGTGSIFYVTQEIDGVGGLATDPQFLPGPYRPPVPATMQAQTQTTMRLVVPLLTVPSQILPILLNGQNCNSNVYQRTTGLYVDLGVDQQLIIAGVLALDRVKIVRDAYLGFTGDLAFWDSQGGQDPDWTGLNTRYFL